jgi:hypothetical protein
MGATPKQTISANESSCLPKLEATLSLRARDPSMESRNTEKRMHKAAWEINPLLERRIETKPVPKDIKVMLLGK